MTGHRLAGAAVVCSLAVGAAARADVFVVTNTVDPGNGTCDAGCTLREAIDAANANPGVDFIHFDIPGAGPHLIRPTSPLPRITENVTIDGSTQPGFAGTPLIEISGELAGAGADGLWITAEFCQIGWLAVNRFDETGILVGPPGGVTVVGCHLGVDPSGTIARPNGWHGMYVYSDNNQIGGTSASLRNVMSGNDGAGLVLISAEDNVVEGNYIGLDRTGTIAIPNGDPVSSTLESGISVNVLAFNNRIGGTASGQRNVISGNADLGIYVTDGAGSGPGGNLFQGNFIGTDASGTMAVPNGRVGILMNGDNNTIGGSAANAGNTIAGNVLSGIYVNADNVTIRGNRIGVDVSGNPMGNNHGISTDEATGLTIGGTGTYERNIIAHNLHGGITVWSGTGHEISANSIHSNVELGIDLGDDGVTPNDSLDVDTGPNDLQNCPEIVSAERSVDGTQLLVTVFIGSKPNNLYRVHYYANDACDPSGSGEGETYLGNGLALTNASGQATLTHTLTASVDLDDEITATATDMATYDTSEFSPCQAVTSAACGPGADSCYVDHLTVGCSSSACCNLVCDLDAYCCQTMWDPLCVQEALDLCGQCGTLGAGPCHLSNSSPGCYEDDCCATVCAVDAFCCNTRWDSVCADEARSMCTLACLADCGANPDGVVDVTDLLAVLAQWGNTSPCDTDDSGTTDVTDLLKVLGDWGPCL
jgi:CSLREA domain-containing protein